MFSLFFKNAAKIKKIFRDLPRFNVEDRLDNIQNEIVAIKEIFIDTYIGKNLFENPRYSNDRKLTKYEYKTYSQCGEDGIIGEIFTRIGVTNRFFVEFGVENGLECNSLFLLLGGWEGCWLDSGNETIKAIKEKFSFLINRKKLSVKQAFITAENIECLLDSLSVPKELDLLSIDIDGNDYWIWKAIDSYAPRVVVIEYNSIFRPDVEWIMSYVPTYQWDGSGYFGASLRSLELLGLKKGYKLVGCNFAGINAFFVREDLVNSRFLEPFTAENHYEPPRYYLYRKMGQKSNFGRFEKNVR